MESDKLRVQITELMHLYLSVINPRVQKVLSTTIKELKVKLEALEKAEKLEVYKCLTEVNND